MSKFKIFSSLVKDVLIGSNETTWTTQAEPQLRAALREFYESIPIYLHSRYSYRNLHLERLKARPFQRFDLSRLSVPSDGCMVFIEADGKAKIYLCLETMTPHEIMPKRKIIDDFFDAKCNGCKDDYIRIFNQRRGQNTTFHGFPIGLPADVNFNSDVNGLTYNFISYLHFRECFHYSYKDWVQTINNHIRQLHPINDEELERCFLRWYELHCIDRQ
jgi:hypothetical protein